MCIPRPSGTWLSSTRILSSQGLGVLLAQDTCVELQAEGGGHRHMWQDTVWEEGCAFRDLRTSRSECVGMA